MNRKLSLPAASAATLTLAAALASPRSVAALVLVKDGKPRATIVVDKKASPQVQRAARLLQEYVFKSSNAKLPIANQANGNAVIVGPLSPALRNRVATGKLDADGFILQRVGNSNYVITGGSDWGTEFGVIDFLERYVGVRWLMPTELGIDVPRLKTLDVPAARILSNPVYRSRRLSPNSKLTEDHPAARWGRFNRARGRIEFHHNLLHLFPGSKFGKTNPEFYPLWDGKRHIPVEADDETWQPNFSAPGIVDAAVRQIDEYFQKNPEATSYSLGMNDSNGWDQSPESLARRSGRKNYLGMEDVSDDYFEWANAVVEKVLKKYPDKWFGTLAYHGIAEPPSRVRVHPRIVPFLTYDRMRWDDPELRAKNQDLTLRWAKVSPVIGWYDYVYGISYQLPRVYFHRMQQYLSWGAAHQVQHSYAELYPNWGEGPKPWVFTKLLWNPNQNVDALLGDWYRHYGGAAAAPKLMEYFSIWEKFWTVDIYKSAWNHKGGEYLPFGDDPTYLRDVPSSYISQSDAALAAALKLADTPQRKARIAKQIEMWDFYKTSILTYLGVDAVSKLNPQNEEQALAALDRAKNVILLSEKRQNILAKFQKDPLFAQTAKYVTDYEGTNGRDWGTSLLWQFSPWVEKSERVKSKLREIAHSSSPAVKNQAEFLLETIAGNSTLVTKNPSFEEGLAGWDIWDKASELAEIHKGVWSPSTSLVFSGSTALRVEGVQRGGIIQNIPYSPGKYFVRARSFVPANSRMGSAEFVVQVRDKNGEVLVGNTSANPGTMKLQPGQWALNAFAFTLPDDPTGKAVSVRIFVLLRDFNPSGEIYFDDFGVYRLDD